MNTSFANFLNNFLHFFLLNAESMNQNTLLIHPLNQYKRKRRKTFDHGFHTVEFFAIHFLSFPFSYYIFLQPSFVNVSRCCNYETF